ncbi:hypothetical protein ABVT39_014229 [Epinephelus coioides]
MCHVPPTNGETSPELVINTDVECSGDVDDEDDDDEDEHSYESASESPISELSDPLTAGQRVSSTPLPSPLNELIPPISKLDSFSTTPEFSAPLSETEEPFQLVKKKRKSRFVKKKNSKRHDNKSTP